MNQATKTPAAPTTTGTGTTKSRIEIITETDGNREVTKIIEPQSDTVTGLKFIGAYVGALFLGVFAIGAACAASDKVFGTNMRDPYRSLRVEGDDNSASA